VCVCVTTLCLLFVVSNYWYVFYVVETVFTEFCGRVVSTPISYPGTPGFESLLRDRVGRCVKICHDGVFLHPFSVRRSRILHFDTMYSICLDKRRWI